MTNRRSADSGAGAQGITFTRGESHLLRWWSRWGVVTPGLIRWVTGTTHCTEKSCATRWGAFRGDTWRTAATRGSPPITENPTWPISRSEASRSSTRPRTSTWTATPPMMPLTPRTTIMGPASTRTCSTTSRWTPPSGVTSCGGARTEDRTESSPSTRNRSTRTPRSTSSRRDSPAATGRPRRARRTCESPR